MKVNWTQELVNTLIDLNNKGLSREAMSMQLGISKNAIAGKCHRLKLVPKTNLTGFDLIKDMYRRGWSFSKIEQKIGKKVSPFNRDRLTGGYGPFTFKRPRIKIEGDKFFSSVNINAKIPMEDLKPGQCRFPSGDGPFLFCGEPVVGSGPYCKHCKKIAYVHSRR